MPKQTTAYKLGYFVDGEVTSQVTEDRRMRTLDSQLLGLYQVLGNGVLSGWEVGASATSGMSVSVSAGKGVITFVAVESTISINVGPLFQNATNYVSATRLPDSYWNRSVAFSITLAEPTSADSILLAVVRTSSSAVISVDNSVRSSIGLISSVENAVKSHRHVGGTSNPDPIDLATQVQGIISQENLPELDASKVSIGKLPKAVIPKIDHASGLQNQGELTHAQLDSLLQNLSVVGKTVMGETALVNLLQLVLALKHQWPDIDDHLVNMLAFIPGISPDTLIDFEHTTAEVDTRSTADGGQHKIYGSTGPGMRVFTKTWDSASEFDESEKDGTFAEGDAVMLEVAESSILFDDFDTVGNWETKIEDLSSSASTVDLDGTSKVSSQYSARVGINTQETSNIAFTMRRVFASQDWSKYNGIIFYINATDLEHGDIFFYLNDSVHGVQNSYTLILGKNEPTINRDTLLNGWREIFVDLTPYQRSSVNTIGLFMSTQYGWDAKTPFTLNVDKVSLTAGNKFLSSGTARFIYGNGFPQDFWRVRWDATVPSGTSITTRTRVSNSLSDFDPNSSVQAPWSAYGSSSGMELETSGQDLYSYVQVEIAMTASSDKRSTPVLARLYLDRKVSADDASFSYDDQDQWESGSRFNIDTASTPGSIKIDSLTDVDNVFYGSNGSAEQAGSDLTGVFSWSGASLPKSTRQALTGKPSGFGQLSAVKRGENDTVWVTDTENDRVLQLDKSGNIVFGLWGSNITEAFDGYGIEESGPGSNTDMDVLPSTSTVNNVPEALYAIYSPSTLTLSIPFSANLESVEDVGTTFNRGKMFLAIGTKRVYFRDDTPFSLYGIDPVKYSQWAMSTNEFIGQFSFVSHVLQAKLSQADSVALTSALSLVKPSIMYSGTEQSIFADDQALLTFSTPNILIGNESLDNNGIRIRVNGGAYSYHRSRSILVQSPEVADGKNTIEATLVDGNDNPFDGNEASCAMTIVVDSNDELDSDPRISISSPKQGQSISTLPVSVAFESHNYPVLEVGSCIEYSVDGGVWQEHRTTDPIEVGGLSGGEHTISLRMVDGAGEPIDTDFSETSVSFNFGVSDASNVSLHVGAGTIRGTTRLETVSTPERKIQVHVANVHMVNMFCPIDIQVIAGETSSINPTGEPTVLVAKLRSPSTTHCLGTQTPVNGQLVPPQDPTVIFGTRYLDGHSVVQYGKNGEVIFSNNASKFADTREHSKTYLGSVSKVASTDLLMADSIRKRAIISRTDLETGISKTIWEYVSDRLVPDFQLATSGTHTIKVTDSSCDNPNMYIRSGEIVSWENKSSVPIRIISGTTTPTIFAVDPDLTLYGDEFASEEIQPGGLFARKFDDGGNFGWFAYPRIVTGSVGVSQGGVSQSDEYLIVEKDYIPSIGSGRVSRIDSWGKILWTFGSGILYDPRDARRLAGDSIIISA